VILTSLLLLALNEAQAVLSRWQRLEEARLKSQHQPFQARVVKHRDFYNLWGESLVELLARIHDNLGEGLIYQEI
jgi:hypothetical protein